MREREDEPDFPEREDGLGPSCRFDQLLLPAWILASSFWCNYNLYSLATDLHIDLNTCKKDAFLLFLTVRLAVVFVFPRLLIASQV